VHEAMTYSRCTVITSAGCANAHERDDGGAWDEDTAMAAGWPITSGRCASGSRCQLFNGLDTHQIPQLTFQRMWPGSRSRGAARSAV